MIDPSKLQISEYNYNLPEDRIAKYPLEKRDESKLLIYKPNGSISHTQFTSVSEFIQSGSTLVVNNTKVIHARLFFRKPSGAKIEVFCLDPIQPSDYEQSFSSTQYCVWKCMVGNLRKWKTGHIECKLKYKNDSLIIKAEKIQKGPQGDLHIKFSWNADISFSEVLAIAGELPIPPYLNRSTEEDDEIRYQTIYSRHEGSVAAPTAGLHITDNVLASLGKNNISLHEVTLHVGAGTFKPVSSDTIDNHIMHAEHFKITLQFLKHLINNISSIVAIGTTSVRTLESLYWLGNKLLSENFVKKADFTIDQWDPYHIKPVLSPTESIQTIISFMENNMLDAIEASTQIIIVPGYKFKIVRDIITNFHMPKSTLLLLIAAFTGEDWKNIYDYALDNNFRFLSYGDSSLLLGK